MPLFNTSQPISIQVGPGDNKELLNGVTDAAAATSIVIAPTANTKRITFTVNQPGTLGTVTIFGSNIAPTSAGVDSNADSLGTVTTANGFVTDTNAFAFYWATSTQHAEVRASLK